MKHNGLYKLHFYTEPVEVLMQFRFCFSTIYNLILKTRDLSILKDYLSLTTKRTRLGYK